jgi:hypothetical protein
MLKQHLLRRVAMLFVIAMVVPLIAACGSQAAQQPVKETGGGEGDKCSR